MRFSGFEIFKLFAVPLQKSKKQKLWGKLLF